MRCGYRAVFFVIALCAATTLVVDAGVPTTAAAQTNGAYKIVGNILLAKVIHAMNKPSARYRVGFEVTVIADYRGDLKGNITVVGNPADQFTNVTSMPDLPPGRVVLIQVGSKNDSGGFECGNAGYAPFGLKMPRPVDPNDVQPMVRMLAELRRLAPPNDKRPVPHEEAERLLKSKEYVEWALGATLLAYEGRATDINELLGALNVGNLTVKQAVWVHYVLSQVAPEKARPPVWRLDQFFSGYFENRSPEFKIFFDWTPGNTESAKPSKAK